MSNLSSKGKKQTHTKRRKSQRHDTKTIESNHFIYGLHAIQAALAAPVSRVNTIWLADERHDERVAEIHQLAQQQQIPVHKVAKSEIAQRFPDVQHQGSLAECKPLEPMSEPELLKLVDDLIDQSISPLLLILDGVQDPHNLGACIRTAEAAGVHAVIAPKDRASGLTATVLKVATGSAERVPFVQVTNLARLLRELRQSGVWLVGTSGDCDTTLYEVELTGPTAMILGAEGKGIRRLTREHCDQIIYIPMQGQTESLNVSVAAGVTLFEAARQRDLLSK